MWTESVKCNVYNNLMYERMQRTGYTASAYNWNWIIIKVIHVKLTITTTKMYETKTK